MKVAIVILGLTAEGADELIKAFDANMPPWSKEIQYKLFEDDEEVRGMG